MYKRKFIPLVLLMILIVNGCSNKQCGRTGQQADITVQPCPSGIYYTGTDRNYRGGKRNLLKEIAFEKFLKEFFRGFVRRRNRKLEREHKNGRKDNRKDYTDYRCRS